MLIMRMLYICFLLVLFHIAFGYIRWFGIDVVIHFEPKYHFSQHAGLIRRQFHKKHWGMTWFAIVSFWMHRNEIIFKGGKLHFENVFELIRPRIWIQCKAAGQGGKILFMDWYINHICCLESFWYEGIIIIYYILNMRVL